MHTASPLLEPLESRIAPANFIVTATADAGAGSLRQAILDANLTAETDSIFFDIAGTGVQTILPATPLPAIVQPLVIDATTQPGYVVSGRPLIELNGVNAGAGAIGLEVLAAGTGVAALTINRFADAGIVLGSSGGLLQSCYIGTDADGAGTGAPANGTGVRITGSDNLIGGTATGVRNVISGNTGAGLLLSGAGATGNLIVNNTIGLRPVVTDGPLPNATGILIAAGASGNQIGGRQAGEGNRIGGNAGAGVALPFPAQSPGNAITGNEIADNGGLGIDLFSDGVTPNGAGHQNFPVLDGASIGGGRTLFRGTLTSTPSTEFEVQFFAIAFPDPSGFGEGVAYAGSAFVTTDATGLAVFSASVDAQVGADRFVTATALDPAGNTSEFSQARAVASGAVVPAIAPTGRVATFRDVDGDLVTVKVNKGRLEPADFQLIAAGAVGGAQFQLLALHDDAGEFSGADISITAKRTAAGGDGFVNLGYLNATGSDLGNVKLAGDLGRIDVGESATTTPGLKSLTVHSLGRTFLATQDISAPAAPSLASTLTGAAGKIAVATDVIGASLVVTGNLGSLTVGRSVDSAYANSLAAIVVLGTLGKARIGGDLIGNAMDNSGLLGAAAIGDLVIGGSILGSSGLRSGRISSDAGIGSVKVGGDLLPGSGEFSGVISAVARIGSVDIHGTASGSIFTRAALGSVKIGGNLTGLVSAQGNASPATSAAALAIGSVKVGGNFNGSILAGYDRLTSDFTNPDVLIGPIVVSGNADLFRISAGIAPGPNAQFADGDDVLVNAGGTAILSQIASFIVKGQVGGFSTGEHLGLTAQVIGKLQIGAVKFPLTAGTDRFLLNAIGNVSLREV